MRTSQSCHVPSVLLQGGLDSVQRLQPIPPITELKATIDLDHCCTCDHWMLWLSVARWAHSDSYPYA